MGYIVYQLSCVPVVLGMSCLVYELSRVRVGLGTSRPCYTLSWVQLVLGTTCLGYYLGTSCLGYDPDSKVYGANIRPTWDQQDPGPSPHSLHSPLNLC